MLRGSFRSKYAARESLDDRATDVHVSAFAKAHLRRLPYIDSHKVSAAREEGMSLVTFVRPYLFPISLSIN